jgi:hypothetical protein
VRPVSRSRKSAAGALSDEASLARARRTQAPLEVPEHAQPPPRSRSVGERENCQLDRILRRNENRQLLLHTLDGVLIARDTGSVPDHPPTGIRTPRQRSRCGSPDCAGVVVTQIESFPGRIGQWIVRERRQPVLAAVSGPRESGPGAAHDRAERGIRYDVRPWQRRLAFAVEDDDVLAAVVREAAQSVFHHKRRYRDGRR